MCVSQIFSKAFGHALRALNVGQAIFVLQDLEFVKLRSDYLNLINHHVYDWFLSGKYMNLMSIFVPS
jgi:ATP:corrinoid adenosyltransferase